MKKNLALFIVSTLVSLVASEFVIRIALPQISEHNTLFQLEDQIGWGFIPSKKSKVIYPQGINHTITTNKDGYRDSPFAEKNGNSKILVLGDSFVSNISVKDNEVFTKLLEQKLKNTSVYNLGVNGYGQVQEYLLLNKWLPIIQPDLIVIVIYLRNDFSDNMGKTPWKYPRPTVVFDEDAEMHISPPSLFQAKAKRPFYSKSHLLHFVKRRVAAIRSKLVNDQDGMHTPPEIHTCRIPLSNETKKMLNKTQNLLLEMDRLGKENGASIVFALAPSLFQVEEKRWLEVEEYDPTLELQNDLPNELLLSFAKANKLEMIDFMPSLKKAVRKGENMYHKHEQHWTAKGNEVIATTLSDYIINRRAKDLQ